MTNERSVTRRTFARQSAATVAATVATMHTGLSRVAYAGGGDTLRLGLVGCGGRGTGAAVQALTADPGVKLVAMADAFEDRLENSLEALQAASIDGADRESAVGAAARVDVVPDRRFAGFDAYRHVIDQVDVVILAATPHFRPRHLAYAVEKGVHIFAEKPVATDSPGVRQCRAACEAAKRKNLNVVSGLCWRYDNSRRATFERVLGGAIGRPVAIETTFNTTGIWDPRRTRDACASEMEYQMRNWYYYTWLSGDHICEQAVHSLNTMSWAVGDQPPIRCWGSGGRQVRTAPRYGNIYDHFNIVYEYPDDVRGYHSCRQWSGAQTRVRDFIFGTEGVCDVLRGRITGKVPWRYTGEKGNMFQNEHDALFAAIRSGSPINNGQYMCDSTLLALMGRMAAYTGQVVTWDMAMKSQLDLSPPAYQWTDVPRRPVARPGTTKFA